MMGTELAPESKARHWGDSAVKGFAQTLSNVIAGRQTMV